ncbi:MAG: RNA 2',3'-cyclic phosphodiesterase [Pseudomonadota bacterium]|nr:RNA 2',3'-cyclic phosphodiesterase [Pseudomonadota bacterium]
MSGTPTTTRKAGGGTHRLFFALWPGEATRGQIAALAAQLRACRPGGRWIPAERYHLTLQFLGTYRHLPAPLVEAACAAGAQVGSPETTIALDRVGSFPDRPHLWWLGCEQAEPLLPLWECLTRTLAAHGVPTAPAPLVPHVTLVRGANRAPPADATVAPVVWRIGHFALVHSESGAATIYHVLRRWPLGLPDLPAAACHRRD